VALLGQRLQDQAHVVDRKAGQPSRVVEVAVAPCVPGVEVAWEHQVGDACDRDRYGAYLETGECHQEEAQVVDALEGATYAL